MSMSRGIALVLFAWVSVASAEPPDALYDCHVHKAGYAATFAVYAKSETHAASEASDKSRPCTVIWCKKRGK